MKNSRESLYKVGTRVNHNRFGRGTVKAVGDRGLTMSVSFDNYKPHASMNHWRNLLYFYTDNPDISPLVVEPFTDKEMEDIFI